MLSLMTSFVCCGDFAIKAVGKRNRHLPTDKLDGDGFEQISCCEPGYLAMQSIVNKRTNGEHIYQGLRALSGVGMYLAGVDGLCDLTDKVMAVGVVEIHAVGRFIWRWLYTIRETNSELLY